MRKKAYHIYIIFVIAIVSFLMNIWLNKFRNAKIKSEKLEMMVDLKDLNLYKKCGNSDLGFKIVFPERKLENLQLIGFETPFGVAGRNETHKLYGMILRSLRYQNITKKIEKKYGLPDNLLLAMVMQETGGVELLPNSNDDGGIGLCHMQPEAAVEFGLRTFENCKALVSKKHGKKLRKLIDEHDKKIMNLIYYDDRFHPILNLDAVGRMLSYYMGGKKLKNTKLETAIFRYAGSKNFETYYKNVTKYREKLNDSSVINNVRIEFAKRNKNFKINNKKADFDDYINYCHNRNRNFGLDDYK